MKRWLSGLLAVLLLFSGSISLAEPEPDASTADIQESMVSREGEAPSALSDNLNMLLEVLENEDFKSLLAMDEVKSITSEVIWRVLVWMIRNRPVTMKILAELGAKENDLRCVEKLWDSAERVSEALTEHAESEDGKRLQAELKAVKEDPDIQETVENFLEMATSEDVDMLLYAINATPKEGAEAEGSLTKEAIDRQINRTGFMGRLIYELMYMMDRSEWARESLPKLQKNENLWRLVNHLAGGNSELERVFREEFTALIQDPEMVIFIHEISQDVLALVRTMKGTSEKTENEGNQQETTDEGGAL